jgi:hypothetical protein
MRRAGMSRIAGEHTLRDGGCLHVRRHVAHTGQVAKQCQGIKQLHLIVVRMIPGQFLHRAQMSPVALGFRALTVEFLHREKETSLTFVLDAGEPRRAIRTKTVEALVEQALGVFPAAKIAATEEVLRTLANVLEREVDG